MSAHLRPARAGSPAVQEALFRPAQTPARRRVPRRSAGRPRRFFSTTEAACSGRISSFAAILPRRDSRLKSSTGPESSLQSVSQSPRNANGCNGVSIVRLKSTPSAAWRKLSVTPLPERIMNCRSNPGKGEKGESALITGRLTCHSSASPKEAPSGNAAMRHDTPLPFFQACGA